MASLGPKEVVADQVLGSEFLVSLTFSSFSIDRYCIQQSFKCNTYGDKKVLRLGISSGVNYSQKASNWHSLPCSFD